MASSRIRVFIIDDSLTIRAMISTILERHPRIKVVGIAASAEEADVMLQHLVPDVVLLDIKLPGMNGLQFLRELRRWLDKPIIMLSALMKPGSPERIEAIRLGAAGAFYKAHILGNSDVLIGMILDAAAGRLNIEMDEMHLPPPVLGGTATEMLPSFA